MKFKFKFACLLSQLILASLALSHSSNLLAYGTGLSSYPLPEHSGALTTEFSTFFSDEKGLGLQARYLRKINQRVAIEGSIGASDSQLSKRFGVAGDIEVSPDVDHYPRFVVRPFIERSTEYGKNYNTIGAYPILSKGYVFFENTGYPFVSLPMSVAFSSGTNQFRMAAAFGITGKLPISGYDNVLLNLEGSINITQSFNGIFLGLSYPL
ncbi:MAG: hypothetical protein HQK50_09860 [Oligoflexia bacterium]|nr:hypothetical protein [Oligoflexia bacterium]MBF0365866.1 hypothetical protein [Oligoflexia bacterium]